MVTGGRFREAGGLLEISTDDDDPPSPFVFRVLYQFLTAAVALATAAKDGFSWRALAIIDGWLVGFEFKSGGFGAEAVDAKLLVEPPEMLRVGLGEGLDPLGLETTSSVRPSKEFTDE